MDNLMKVFTEEYAGIYDYLYQDKNYEGECDFIETIFNRFSKRVRTVLDLGCGTGGHALVLSKRGYQVIGVDRSKRMLDIAKIKADKASLSIEFIEADIRNFNLQERFDAVISLFAVMSYQTTNEAMAEACKVARKHLVPKGVFLFDCWNGLAVLTDKPTVRIKEVHLNDKERIIRFTEPILNPLTHTSEIRFKVLKIQEERLLNEFEECHLMRYLFPQEIKYFLEVAGFKKVEFCPFLEIGKPLTEHDWNMTVIANTE